MNQSALTRFLIELMKLKILDSFGSFNPFNFQSFSEKWSFFASNNIEINFDPLDWYSIDEMDSWQIFLLKAKLYR